MQIDWKKNCKDTMWAMFWLKANAGNLGTENDKEFLKDSVARLIRMTTQKTAGQRGKKEHVDWNAMEHTLMTIACCATSMCLAGEFGPMPEFIEEAD